MWGRVIGRRTRPPAKVLVADRSARNVNGNIGGPRGGRQAIVAFPKTVRDFHLDLAGRRIIALDREIRSHQRNFLRQRLDVYFPADVVENKRRAAFDDLRSEEHTSELQSLMRISYAV